MNLGFVWRILVCPITAPLLYVGAAMMSLSQFIAYGKWHNPMSPSA